MILFGTHFSDLPDCRIPVTNTLMNLWVGWLHASRSASFNVFTREVTGPASSPNPKQWWSSISSSSPTRASIRSNGSTPPSSRATHRTPSTASYRIWKRTSDPHPRRYRIRSSGRAPMPSDGSLSPSATLPASETTRCSSDPPSPPSCRSSRRSLFCSFIHIAVLYVPYFSWIEFNSSWIESNLSWTRGSL